MMYTFLLVILFGSCLIAVNGTHFLGGTITWQILNESATGSPVAVVITQTYSWTYTIAQCTGSNIANSNAVPISTGYNGVTNALDCVVSCGSGSVGYVAPPILPDCTDVSSTLGTTVGQRSDTVYLKQGDDFTVAFQDSAWRSLQTASSASWSIASHIKIALRSDNGLYNNAPVATMMSPIYIPINTPTAITVPVADADGDTLRCRWSSGSTECGQVCPPGSLPTGATIYSNCTMVITGTILNAWYAVTLMVEDFIDPSSTTALSSVPVEFLIKVVASPACTIPPDIIGLPIEQSCTSVIVGHTFTSQLIAINNCGPTVTIVDIATLSFAGMVQSSVIKIDSTTYYKTLSWTPTSSQIGFQVMCAMALDSQNAQSDQFCFKFYVSQNGVCSCPGDVCITTSSTTSTTSTSTSATTATTSTTSTTSATTSTTSTTSSSTSSTSSSTSSTTSTTSTTTSTSTTSTSTTSTTSTSTTSTTSTSTTTTTITGKPNSTDWPLIGSIAGLCLLAAVTLICCLCCRYCCPLLLGKDYENGGPFEYYYMDHCTDPDCQWSNVSTILPTPRENYLTYNTMDESTISSDNKSSLDYNNGLAMIDFRRDSFLSIFSNRIRRKSTAGISVTKVKLFEGVHSASNRNIKTPNRMPDVDDEILPVPKSATNSNVKVSRVKSATKQRTNSIDLENSLEHSGSQRKSPSALSAVHVTRVLSQTLKPHSAAPHQLRSSLIENTIRLDEIDEVRSLDESKISMKHLRSSSRPTTQEHRLSQIDTIDLSRESIASASSCRSSASTVRVERIATSRKKIKPASTIIPCQPIVEEMITPNAQTGTHPTSTVTVERIATPRKKIKSASTVIACEPIVEEMITPNAQTATHTTSTVTVERIPKKKTVKK